MFLQPSHGKSNIRLLVESPDLAWTSRCLCLEVFLFFYRLQRPPLIALPLQTIKSHTDYASFLAHDYADPLRQLPAIPTAALDRLERTLKSYESALAKTSKAQKKGGPKLLAAQQEASDLQRDLSASLVPEFVTLHQRVTLDRGARLKELAVKWETAQADMGNRRAEASQLGLMRVLAWEPEERVRGLALEKFGGARPGEGQSVSTPSRGEPMRRPTMQSDGDSFRSTPSNANANANGGGGGGGGFASTLKSKFSRKNSMIQSPARARAGSDAQRYDAPSFTPALSTPLNDRREIDNEGFSVPPPDRGNAPWERQATRDLMDDDEEQLRDSSAPRMDSPLESTGPKFSTLALAPAPITESEADRAAALAKMQSTLQSGPQAPKRASTMRGRRDVRNTMFGALDRVDDEASLGEVVRKERQAAGTEMVASPISVSGNPFESSTPGAGLRASFVETISAVIKSGTVQRAMITGEVSLTLNDATSLASQPPLHIRLDAFEQLDKVAPNPRYLSQYPNTPGEYLLDLGALAHASSGKGPTLFKYQVHISEARAAEYTPLEITPQWKPMQGETRLVMTYHANTSSRLATASALTDLKLTVGLGGPEVTTVQAKPPGGTWSPEARQITWTLPDLDLAQPTPGKIVSRFITSGDELGVPEPVTAHFRVDGTLSTGLGVSVVDSAAGWSFEHVARGTTSGKYVVE